MALYLLFRSSHGYGLFKANGVDEIGGTAEAARSFVSDPNRFRRVVQVTAIRPYRSLRDAFYQINAYTRGVMTQELKHFLELHLPLKTNEYSLGTSPKLRSLIMGATQIRCLSDDFVLVLLNGVRQHFESDLYSMKDNTLIPPTVLNTILTRLPIKTLLRFRLACKEWESVICNPEFRGSMETRGYLYTVGSKSRYTIRFCTFRGNQVSNGILEETHGKLELENTTPFDPFYQELEKYKGNAYHLAFPLYPAIEHEHGLILLDDDLYGIIYNPSTRECLNLPEVPTRGLISGKTFLFYDSGTKDYMCLRLQQQEGVDGQWLEARAMCLGDSAWKMVILPSEGIGWCGRPYTTRACLNGCFYVVDSVQVLRFNPSSLTLEFVCCVPRDMVKPYHLFVYEGKLAVTSRFMGLDDEAHHHPCLYTLDQEGAWTRVDFVLSEETASTLKLCEMRDITGKGELIFVSPEFSQDNIIYFFNPKDGALTTSAAAFEGMVDVDRNGTSPRALLDIDHVDNHLRFLKA